MLSVTFDAPPTLLIAYVLPDPMINLSLRFGVPFVPSQSCHPDGTVAPDHIMMPPTGIVPGPSNPELARAFPQMSSLLEGFVVPIPTFPFEVDIRISSVFPGDSNVNADVSLPRNTIFWNGKS